MTFAKTLLILSATALVLGACTPFPSTSTSVPTDTTPIIVESTGNAQKDADIIEKELHGLDESADFPDINESDFSL